MKNVFKISFLLTTLILLGHEAKCQDYYVNDNHYQYTITVNPSLPDFVFYVFLDTSDVPLRIEIRHSGSDSILQTIKLSDEDPHKYSSTTFYTEDMNFDGYRDILWMYNFGSAEEQFHVRLYDPQSGLFRYDPQFDELWDPQTNPARKTITSVCVEGYESSKKKTYRIEKGLLVLLRTERKIYIDEVNGNKRWERIIELYKHNKLKSIKVDTLKEEE
jgi:hypothetical protein